MPRNIFKCEGYDRAFNDLKKCVEYEIECPEKEMVIALNFEEAVQNYFW